MMVAYPLMALDQIGIELQNPFSKANLSHLPLGNISATIEKNLLGLLEAHQTSGAAVSREADERPAIHVPATIPE